MSLINHHERTMYIYNDKNIKTDNDDEINQLYKKIKNTKSDNKNYGYENNLSINEYYKNRYNHFMDQMDYLSNIGEIIIEQFENNKNQIIYKNTEKGVINKVKRKQQIKTVENDDIFNYLTLDSKNQTETVNNNINQYNFIINNKSTIKDKDICPNCQKSINNLIVDNKMICKYCGYYENKTLFCSPENNDIVKKINYPYKRLNHFKECLNQLQAKETINIPENVKAKILHELKKKKFNDLKVITYKDIKTIIKSLKLSRYYDHYIYITVLITGKQPPILKKQEEKEILNMFQSIINIYELLDSNKRINFLNYSYVLHKIFQLTNNQIFMNLCPLLKSNDKLIEQDKIWKQICQKLNWHYIPSI